VSNSSAAAVRRYFANVYPDRDSRVAGWFRVGEVERRCVVGRWLRGATALRLLDVGAGDGGFLASALPVRPAAIALVDLSARVEAAASRLRSAADRVSFHVGDVERLPLEPADIVSARGITVYHRDWPSRRGRPRNAARRLWLWSHGVPLRTADRRAVAAALAPLGTAEIVATRFHWLARMQGGPP
jgi:SAM-dependent methyltransferase